jgi:site-specific DNA-methyltransferase (adenine-specific)
VTSPLREKVCRDTEWRTPPAVLDVVRAYFRGRIPLDPAASSDNPTNARRFFTRRENGLRRAWSAPSFVNPPYGRAIRAWAAKIHEEAARGTEIVALLPAGARFGTRYWQEHILIPQLSALCFHRGRIEFLDRQGRPSPSRNMYDSIFYLYNGHRARFERAFAALGRVLLVVESLDDIAPWPGVAAFADESESAG